MLALKIFYESDCASEKAAYIIGRILHSVKRFSQTHCSFMTQKRSSAALRCLLPEAPDTLIVGRHRLPLSIMRNRRARRISLRYNPVDHAFHLTLPRHARLQDGLNFIRLKEEWVAETLERIPPKIFMRDGAWLSVLGKERRLEYAPGIRSEYRVEGRRLRIASVSKVSMGKDAKEVLKKMLRERISELAHKKAKEIGCEVKRITIRDTRSRWGSCSSSGRLSFSWRLIFAPEDVLDYVVSHEVAHLRIMNHSPRFWNLVGQICPHYHKSKDWLTQNAQELYRYVV